MKIKELKDLVDKAYENGKDCDVEFWLCLDDEENIFCNLESIGQFSVIPDMTITIKPKNEEQRIYTTKIMDKEQFEYRERYKKLREQLIDIYNNL